MSHMKRSDVYNAIDSERYRQDRKWGTVIEHPHEVGAWLTIMRTILNEADKQWAQKDGDAPALVELLKLISVGVACAEQHGIGYGVIAPSYKE